MPCLVAKPTTPAFICCAPFLLIAWFKSSFLLWTFNSLSFTSFCFNSTCRREWFASFPRFLILFDVDGRGVSVSLWPEACIIIIPLRDSSAVAGATDTRVPKPWVTIGGNKMESCEEHDYHLALKAWLTWYGISFISIKYTYIVK